VFPKCEDIEDSVFLVYNEQCDFCERVAKFFSKGWCKVKVVMVPNTSKEVPNLGLSYECVLKDVHVVVKEKLKDGIILSKGAACFFMMSLKFPIANNIYNLIPWICEKSYLILKKIKGYL
jgi:hypothetical protein